MAVAALVLGLPLVALARPAGDYAPVIAGAGDQSDPSVYGSWIVYASSVDGDFDVLRYAIGAPAETILPVAIGLGDQDQPDVYGTVVAYRGPGGVFVRDWNDPNPSPLRAPGGLDAACGPATESQPSVAALVAAWQCETGAGRSIAVLRHQTTLPEYRLVGDDLYAPATHGSLVAFVDGADGASVSLHDARTRTRVPVCSGVATGVGVGEFAGRVVVAATRGTQPDGADADVELWEPSSLVTALRIRGQQRNPHVSGDWVAFEDLSTQGSQVVLWQWTTGLVFLPHPSESDQTLNDLAAIPGSEIRAVFAEAPTPGAVDHDVALYRLFVDQDGNIRDDGTKWDPLPWDVVAPPGPTSPASCDDPDPVVLATFTVERGRGTPRAASVEFAARPNGDETPMPVLVCLEAQGVTAGWMTLDDEAIAWPRDFDLERARVAIPAVAMGTSRVAAVIGGKPGSKLFVRVLADPARPPPTCGAGDDDDGDDQGEDDGDDDEGEEHVDSGRDWDHDLDGDHDQGFGNSGWREVPAWRFDRRICETRQVPQPEGLPKAYGCDTAGGGGVLALLALLFAARRPRRR